MSTMASQDAEATHEQWKAEQLQLKTQLIETDVVQWHLGSHVGDAAATAETKSCRKLSRVAGVDISFLKGSNEHACASIVVLEYPSLSVLYEAFTYVSLPAPYIAGFLAFREVPALTKLYDDLRRRRPDLLPDVTLVDGNGVLHPQGFGLASHFGVLENIPTIGVGKTFLHVDGLTKPDVKGLMARAREESHDLVKLAGKSGKVWGAALCGTAGVKNPVYVSVGHMLSLDSSVAIAQACSQFRVPEPIRQADLRSRDVIRQWERAGAVDTTLDLYHAYPASDA
ncbi:Chaperone DnaJ [Phytophthora cinnamomi]|uniref:Chaperone DnaJ n=1 Tax=Phytophthora cinnamomi TaxID=4785 RepID=UPI00355A4CE5|nr:Chaperone DnaJ [Phytophthora cinnamomi]